MVTYLRGARSTADWVTNLRPENWRQMIALEYPRGDVSLTALTTMMRTESVDDYKFHWWNEDLPQESGDVTNVYINSDLDNTKAYVYATHQATFGISGAVVYANVAATVADMFVPDDQVVLRDKDHAEVDVNGRVVAVMKNGANSYIAVRLLEADDNGSATYNLATVDYIVNLGAIGSELGRSPQIRNYDPTEYYNVAGIVRTPLEISGTALETKLRAGKAYADELRRATLLHGLALERRFLFSQYSDGNGTNGKPAPTTQGLLPAIRANASSNVSNYISDSNYAGKAWTTGGADWFKTMLEQLFRYGEDTKMALCGSSVLLGIDRLASTFGQINLKPRETVFGLRIHEWETPFGTLMLKNHPLLTKDETTRDMMVIFEPDKLKYVYVKNRDTKLYQNIQDKETDGRKDEFRTQAGLEFHGLNGFGILSGFNSDNTAS